MKINIPKGCVFGSSNPMWLGRAINAIQWLWSKDSESRYSHTGLFIDNEGTTFESLSTARSQDFYKAYKDDKVIIARPLCDEKVIDLALIEILKHKGQFYPYWRLIFHIIPPVAKVGVLDRLVCSELVAKYEWLLGVRHGQYRSTNPDSLVDEWIRWKAFEIIFEGIVE